MKKILLCFLCFCSLISVNADSSVQARIGNRFFDTLEEAIANATSNDIISLTSDVSLSKGLEINKNVNINLNNHTIETDSKVFLVQGGSLNVSGTGTIREKKPYYGAVVLIGSDNPNDVDYSTVSIGENVTLEGWSGIFIDHDNKNSYGVLVNMNGKINAVSDTNGDSGVGVYVNGYIKHLDNAPIINLGKTAKIKSDGVGIYSAGFSRYYVNGAWIEGVEAGLGIKSGTVKILDGTILGTGEDKTPTTGNNDGINPSGAAIQIESNNSYIGNIELDIRGGTIKSIKSYAIYEYTVGSANTKIKTISLSGGTYLAKSDYPVLKMSDSFNGVHTGFISGGLYSSSPSSYLEDGYSSKENGDSLYEVVNKDMSSEKKLQTNNEQDNKKRNNNWIYYSIAITIFVTLSILIYLNFSDILRFLGISR